jgi:integrase
MSPRKATLRVAHQRDCPNENKTALAGIGRGSGCKCQPSYYVFQRDRDGRPQKSKRVKDRQTADKMLRAAQRELDEGRGGFRRSRRATFDEWSLEHEARLEGRVKPRTLEGYRQTFARARKTLGSHYLDEIGNRELSDFDDITLKNDSRLRYLRELSACLQTAVDDNAILLNDNPVPAYMRRLKNQGVKRRRQAKAPFDQDELPLLWRELHKLEEKVYLHAAKFSSETGLRLRELIALDWENVSLADKTVFVKEQFHEKWGTGTPQSGDMRMIYMTPFAVSALEEWIKVNGHAVEGPVFPHPVTGGRLSAQVVQDRFETARIDSGVPKNHPTMREPGTEKPLPRTFHSLRYTCAALMRFRRYPDALIRKTTGHAGLEMVNHYAEQTPDMFAAMAAQVPASTTAAAQQD